MMIRVDDKGQPIMAIAMVSGGLDSTLALRLMAGMGIEIHGVSFSTGFSPAAHHRARTGHASETPEDAARTAVRALQVGADVEVAVHIVDVADEFLHEVLMNPQYGRGREMNPCIDCRIFLLRKARSMMEEIGAHFVFTGEVLGQRPMSEDRLALLLVEEQSGLNGLLLRPLSARHLEPTTAEEKGWVDRQQLLAIRGRSRKTQIELAASYGITDYSQPAGGCLLTDPSFSQRLQDTFDHTDDKSTLTVEDMELLKVGRHFRLPSGVKVVVGRDDAENRCLEELNVDKWSLRALDWSGPLTLADVTANDDDLYIAAALTARYSQGRAEPRLRVLLSSGEVEKEIEVEPLDRDGADRWMI